MICTATNETPHSKIFTFQRRSPQGFCIPDWLNAGKEAYLKVFIRAKDDPPVQPVKILEVINPFFARVERNGRIDTVSTQALSPGTVQTHTSTSLPGSDDLPLGHSQVNLLPDTSETDLSGDMRISQFDNVTRTEVGRSDDQLLEIGHSSDQLLPQQDVLSEESSTHSRDVLSEESSTHTRPVRNRKPPDRLQIKW